MSPEEVLSHPSRVLSQSQRERYFEQGYVQAPAIIASEWIERLRSAINELVENTRSMTESEGPYDLEEGHCAEVPRLRRITNPSALHPVIWEYVSESMLADIVADLLGPDVKFMDTMMNFKWASGGTEINWHQDAPYFPHTNYNLLTIGTYLDEVGLDNAPMGVIPGSHTGKLYSLYGSDGRWSGHLSNEDLSAIDVSSATYLTGPTGTVQAHNSCMIHGSAANESSRGRPILLATYAPADALPYVPYPSPSVHSFTLVRGKPASVAYHDPRPCPLPPDWSKGEGYQSIFVWQQKEAGDEAGKQYGSSE